ncbi:hypothetical protein L6164_008194 [Bauhinia variegata]|uniref:Uncharacterized protein n=1 Tax=Bauhinia variegata TaxID=167791 RepID=A0ACB9PG88_BAUVA|nr:hypothetical protein L6164_008194 [Bauhinia variegata]
MKTAILALSFFLFAFATADTVLDTDGNRLLNGGIYYILPAFRGMGGGLALTRVGRETCPRTVVQSFSELSNGLPVRISTPPRIAIIRTGWNVDIEFITVPACTSKYSSAWHIPEDSDLEGSVKIGAEERFQGKFRIEKASEDAYKLMYCPSSSSDESCRDLGIAIDEERNRRLVVKDGNPFLVRFKKATPIQDPEKWSIV